MNGAVTDFVGDPLWNRPASSYTLAAMADAAAQAAVVPLTAAIAAAAGGADHLHLPPPETLHVSLYSMAPARRAFDKEAYWRLAAQDTYTVLRDWCATQPPFDLHFTSLRAMPEAVIAVAAPAEPVWTLRRRCAERLPPPPGGAPRYDLIHMTLARYARPQALPGDFAARIGAIAVDMPFALQRVLLMREKIYPSLSFDSLDTMALGAPEVTA